MSFSRLIAAPFGPARPLGGIVLAIVAAALGLWVRYAFIEPEKFGVACEAAGPWWCVLRRGLMMAAGWQAIGLLAIAAALTGALAARRLSSPALHVAMFTGGAGLVLYNASIASAAVVLALLGLVLRREGPTQAA